MKSGGVVVIESVSCCEKYGLKEEIESVAKEHGMEVHFYHVGDIVHGSVEPSKNPAFQKEIDARVLDRDESELKIAREMAYAKISKEIADIYHEALRETKKKPLIVIEDKAAFRWKGKTDDTFDEDAMALVDPDAIIHLFDDFRTIYINAEKSVQWKGQFKDPTVVNDLQSNSINYAKKGTELLEAKRQLEKKEGKNVPFFILPAPQPYLVPEILFSDKPMCYLAYAYSRSDGTTKLLTKAWIDYAKTVLVCLNPLETETCDKETGDFLLSKFGVNGLSETLQSYIQQKDLDFMVEHNNKLYGGAVLAFLPESVFSSGAVSEMNQAMRAGIDTFAVLPGSPSMFDSRVTHKAFKTPTELLEFLNKNPDYRIKYRKEDYLFVHKIVYEREKSKGEITFDEKKLSGFLEKWFGDLYNADRFFGMSVEEYRNSIGADNLNIREGRDYLEYHGAEAVTKR